MTPLSVATLGLLDRGSSPALEIAVLGFLRSGGTPPTPPATGFVPISGSGGGTSGPEYTGSRRKPGHFGSDHHFGPDHSDPGRPTEILAEPEPAPKPKPEYEPVESPEVIRRERAIEARIAALEYRAQEQARIVAAVEAARQAEIAQAALEMAAKAKFEEEIAIALLLVC